MCASDEDLAPLDVWIDDQRGAEAGFELVRQPVPGKQAERRGKPWHLGFPDRRARVFPAGLGKRGKRQMTLGWGRIK
jgi:hypothetical protein